MNRCPKCHRFGITNRIGNDIFECVWKDCNYMTKNLEDITNAKHDINRFKKFRDSITRKTKLV